jgi:FMN phosphatase YigB (HAD superfamily)
MAAINSRQQRTLILDLGDVLCHWSTDNLTAVSPKHFQGVIRSPTWGELERGHISEKEAIKTIGEELSLDPNTIHKGLMQCHETLRVDQTLTTQLKDLKEELGGRLKVYAMSNIAKEHFALVKNLLYDWDLFDGEFLSFEVGMTKPDLEFHKHVLDSIGLSDPSSAIFVDDKIANVNAARTFGIQGIVFDSSTALIRQLRNQLMNPIARARQYMNTNAHNHISCIQDGPVLVDNFSQFLIHIELNDDSVISLSSPNASHAEIKADIKQARDEAKKWNFFIGDPVGTTKTCKYMLQVPA